MSRVVVVPIHAEAHDFPFAGSFFDAIVSVDAYHYFGTDDLYLGYIAHFLKEEGRIAVVSPGLVGETVSKIPEELAPYWAWDFRPFHCPEMVAGGTGRRLAKSTSIWPILIEEGWQDWLTFSEAKLPQTNDQWKKAATDEVAMLRVDQGKHLGFTRIVATKV